MAATAFLAESQALFQARLPHRPYCSDDPDYGLVIRDSARALRRRYIQHNQPALKSWLVYDIDKPGAAMIWADADLPPPNLVIQNPCNGHAHVAYALAAPVCVSAAARPHPLRFAGAIDVAYRDRLQADLSYAGLIMKNPLHRCWRTFAFRREPYDLAELADYVDLSKYARGSASANASDYGLGRNCALFEQLRCWAYGAVRRFWGSAGFDRWHTAVEAQASAYNVFPKPLPYSEVKSTAKSVARWTWSRCTPDQFEQLVARTHSSERQRARGVRSGEARKQKAEEKATLVKALRDRETMSVRQIAAVTGIPRSTVGRLLKM